MPAANVGLRAFVADGPGHIVAALHAADVLPPDSPVPASSRDCAPSSVSMATASPRRPTATCRKGGKACGLPRRRQPQLPPAPGIMAATVVELPGLDGAQIAIVGLHHGERGTIMHLLASGVTPEDDWTWARGVRPPPVLWIRGSTGRWHTIRTDGVSPWSDSGVVTLWL